MVAVADAESADATNPPYVPPATGPLESASALQIRPAFAPQIACRCATSAGSVKPVVADDLSAQ